MKLVGLIVVLAAVAAASPCSAQLALTPERVEQLSDEMNSKLLIIKLCGLPEETIPKDDFNTIAKAAVAVSQEAWLNGIATAAARMKDAPLHKPAARAMLCNGAADKLKETARLYAAMAEMFRAKTGNQ